MVPGVLIPTVRLVLPRRDCTAGAWVQLELGKGWCLVLPSRPGPEWGSARRSWTPQAGVEFSLPGLTLPFYPGHLVKHSVIEHFIQMQKIEQCSESRIPIPQLQQRATHGQFLLHPHPFPSLVFLWGDSQHRNYVICKYSSMNLQKTQTLKKYLPTIPLSHLKNIDIFLR